MKENLSNKLLIYLIVLSHLAGIIGLWWYPTRSFFLALTPYQLFLMAIIAIYVQKGKTLSFWITISFLVLVSFIVEYLGVRTGKIFGYYSYGNALGINFLQVPIVIGFNWLTLIVSSSAIVPEKINKLALSLPLRAFCSAGLMVLLDIFIEPIAVFFHYWSWKNQTVPLQNYLAWFIFSFIFCLIYQMARKGTKNFPQKVLYISQLIFFLALNIILIKKIIA